MIGVIVLLILAVFIAFHSRPRLRLIAAFVGTALWTWFCGLTIFHLWWKAGFVGSWSEYKLHLVRQTIPAYWILGCLVMWLVYVLRQGWDRWFRAGIQSQHRPGFDVVAKRSDPTASKFRIPPRG